MPFLEHQTFEGINPDGSTRTIDTYNIEILGAGHSDFDSDNNPTVNKIMRELNLAAAGGEAAIEAFLFERDDGAVEVRNGIIYFDPSEFETTLGN